MVSLLLGFALIAGGCNSVPEQVHSTESISQADTKAEKAQKILDNAKANVIAASQTVSEFYSKGLLTKAEALKYATKIEAGNNTLNEGYYLLSIGKAVEAGERGELIDGLMDLLIEELVKIKQESENGPS
jgi:cell division protein YceG involved in septum cleavage